MTGSLGGADQVVEEVLGQWPQLVAALRKGAGEEPVSIPLSGISASPPALEVLVPRILEAIFARRDLDLAIRLVSRRRLLASRVLAFRDGLLAEERGDGSPADWTIEVDAVLAGVFATARSQDPLSVFCCAVAALAKGLRGGLVRIEPGLAPLPVTKWLRALKVSPAALHALLESLVPPGSLGVVLVAQGRGVCLRAARAGDGGGDLGSSEASAGDREIRRSKIENRKSAQGPVTLHLDVAEVAPGADLVETTRAERDRAGDHALVGVGLDDLARRLAGRGRTDGGERTGVVPLALATETRLDALWSIYQRFLVSHPAGESLSSCGFDRQGLAAWLRGRLETARRRLEARPHRFEFTSGSGVCLRLEFTADRGLRELAAGKDDEQAERIQLDLPSVGRVVRAIVGSGLSGILERLLALCPEGLLGDLFCEDHLAWVLLRDGEGREIRMLAQSGQYRHPFAAWEGESFVLLWGPDDKVLSCSARPDVPSRLVAGSGLVLHDDCGIVPPLIPLDGAGSRHPVALGFRRIVGPGARLDALLPGLRGDLALHDVAKGEDLMAAGKNWKIVDGRLAVTRLHGRVFRGPLAVPAVTGHWITATPRARAGSFWVSQPPLGGSTPSWWHRLLEKVGSGSFECRMENAECGGSAFENPPALSEERLETAETDSGGEESVVVPFCLGGGSYSRTGVLRVDGREAVLAVVDAAAVAYDLDFHLVVLRARGTLGTEPVFMRIAIPVRAAGPLGSGRACLPVRLRVSRRGDDLVCAFDGSEVLRIAGCGDRLVPARMPVITRMMSYLEKTWRRVWGSAQTDSAEDGF